MNRKQEHLIKALEALEEMADEKFDGHVTIFKFTTGWKVVFETPDLEYFYNEKLGDMSPVCDRAIVQGLPDRMPLAAAIEVALSRHTSF